MIYIVTKESDDGTFEIVDHIFSHPDGSIEDYSEEGWIEAEQVEDYLVEEWIEEYQVEEYTKVVEIELDKNLD